ncbi:MAG TPA: aminotransferase [Clostridiales bacterium]|nr:aminotransferase [Clostridiales bacterium]
MVKVRIEKCREHARIPFYARPGDAGMDVCAAEELFLAPGETGILWTGLKLAIPEGYEIQVRPRSGLSFNTPLRISNAPGTIDSGYRDELGVIMTNTSPKADGVEEETFTVDSKGKRKGICHIRQGDRIAQLVLARVPRMELVEVPSVAEFGSGRGGGFGSTGTGHEV